MSFTCVPCKLLEHIVCSNIMTHLDEYQILSDRQHAFRKRHSCETQLTTVINDWVKILDKGRQVDTFILDFEKAFDAPPHELLKSKLFGYGIGGKILRWIDSFLCYRKQRAVVSSCGHGTQAINQSHKSVNEWRIRMFISTDMDPRIKDVIRRPRIVSIT